MKAALLVEPGRIALDDVADPEPGPGEVRVAVGGVGLCGSDLNVFNGRWEAPSYPWVMGHEAFGFIDAVGPNVSPDRIGQRIVVEPNVACDVCEWCESGRTSACVSRRSVGMNRPGALAEMLVVPSRYARSIPDLPVTDLVCVEPATVVMAALRRLLRPLPQSALVVGVGAQGLMMSLALTDRGVATYGQDVNPDRVDFAMQLGGLGAPGKRRLGLVVDTVGSPASMVAALDHVEVGGSILCLGLDSRPLDLDAQTLVRNQLTLQGSLTYDHPNDFETTIAMLADGRFAPGSVITDEYPLEETQLAFDQSGSRRGKTWISVTLQPN